MSTRYISMANAYAIINANHCGEFSLSMIIIFTSWSVTNVSQMSVSCLFISFQIRYTCRNLCYLNSSKYSHEYHLQSPQQLSSNLVVLFVVHVKFVRHT